MRAVSVKAGEVNLLLQFSYLQILDILTTLAFLVVGVKEANPLIRFIVTLGPSPLAGLVGVKILAFCLALYCVRCARLRLLAGVNLFFAGLVAWNLLVLIVSAPQMSG